LTAASMIVAGQIKGKQHLNPMVDLLLQHKPVFGIYAPSMYNLPGATPPQRGARGGRGNAGGPPPQEDPCGEAAEFAKNPPVAKPLTPAEIETQGKLARLALADHATVTRTDAATREMKAADVP